MLIRITLILLGLITSPAAANDVWQEPNAWEIHSPSPSKTCPVCENFNQDDLATAYYRKIVSHLFNRSSLKENTGTGQFERSVIFSLTPGQLTIIENSSDLRDFNAAVIAILTTAKEPELPIHHKSDVLQSCFFILLDSLSFVWQSLSQIANFFSTIYSYNSEVRFVFFLCGILCSVWFIHKRYNKNLIILLILSVMSSGYLCTYIECNRQLEAETFIEFIQKTEPEEKNYISKMFGQFFKLSKKDEKIQQIKNEAKVKLPYCRPDQVAVMYFNNMFFTELQFVVEKMADSMNILRDKIPFPYNYAGMIAFPFLFISILPLLFKYIFNPSLWLHLFRTSNTKNDHEQEKFNSVPSADRLSGDNLKILFEVLKNKADENTKNSGVEDINDIPEAIMEKETDNSAAEERSNEKKNVPTNDNLDKLEKES